MSAIEGNSGLNGAYYRNANAENEVNANSSQSAKTNDSTEDTSSGTSGSSGSDSSAVTTDVYASKLTDQEYDDADTDDDGTVSTQEYYDYVKEQKAEKGGSSTETIEAAASETGSAKESSEDPDKEGKGVRVDKTV